MLGSRIWPVHFHLPPAVCDMATMSHGRCHGLLFPKLLLSLSLSLCLSVSLSLYIYICIYIYLQTEMYADQEATVRTGYGTTDWFQIRKGVCQGCISSPCLFNIYAEYIMRNAGLDEEQAGIKIAGRNINNLNMQMIPPLWQKAKTKQKNKN